MYAATCVEALCPEERLTCVAPQVTCFLIPRPPVILGNVMLSHPPLLIPSYTLPSCLLSAALCCYACSSTCSVLPLFSPSLNTPHSCSFSSAVLPSLTSFPTLGSDELVPVHTCVMAVGAVLNIYSSFSRTCVAVTSPVTLAFEVHMCSYFILDGVRIL